MKQGLYYQLADIEDRHWWHVSRCRLVEAMLSALPLDKKFPGLDVGCGTGGNLELLQRHCSYVLGMDSSKVALELARKKQPGCQYIRADANQLSDVFKPASFGLVSVFHVLYHQWIKDEQDVLRQISEILIPGGYLIITEPAFPCLMRRHDIQDMGKTRYRIKTFQCWLNQAGFEIRKTTYFNAIGFLPALAVKGWERIHPSTDQGDTAPVDELKVPSPVINQGMLGVMAMEEKIIQVFGKIPFGVSLLCLAQKKK